MSAIPGPHNAIVYAQFNMAGRWKRLLGVTVGYALFIGGAIFLSNVNDTNHSRDVFQGWLGGIIALQVLNLLVFGSFRVDSAVRGDVTSRMIESHRLMPAQPLGSILGYIVGGPLQALLIAIANFGLGTVCCVMANISLNNWAMANAVLLSVAVCMYSLIVQFAFVSRGGFLLTLIGLAIISMGASGEIVQILPSLSVLASPLIGRASVFFRLFSSPTFGINVSYAYFAAVAGQLAIAAVCVRVAIRRYQSASTIGFSPLLGLLLLVIWVGLALVDFSDPETFNFRRFGNSVTDHTPQVVATFVTAILISTLPIASAAKILVQSSALLGAASPKRRWELSLGVTTLLAALIVGSVLIKAPYIGENFYNCVLLTLLIVLLIVISNAAFFAWGYLKRWNPWIFVFVWMALNWVGPVLADVVYHGMMDTPAEAGEITAASPVGALGLMWSGSKVQIAPGLVFQCIAAAIPLLLALNKNRQRHRLIASSTITTA